MLFCCCYRRKIHYESHGVSPTHVAATVVVVIVIIDPRFNRGMNGELKNLNGISILYTNIISSFFRFFLLLQHSFSTQLKTNETLILLLPYINICSQCIFVATAAFCQFSTHFQEWRECSPETHTLTWEMRISETGHLIPISGGANNLANVHSIWLPFSSHNNFQLNNHLFIHSLMTAAWKM